MIDHPEVALVLDRLAEVIRARDAVSVCDEGDRRVDGGDKDDLGGQGGKGGRGGGGSGGGDGGGGGPENMLTASRRNGMALSWWRGSSLTSRGSSWFESAPSVRGSLSMHDSRGMGMSDGSDGGGEGVVNGKGGGGVGGRARGGLNGIGKDGVIPEHGAMPEKPGNVIPPKAAKAAGGGGDGVGDGAGAGAARDDGMKGEIRIGIRSGSSVMRRGYSRNSAGSKMSSFFDSYSRGSSSRRRWKGVFFGGEVGGVVLFCFLWECAFSFFFRGLCTFCSRGQKTLRALELFLVRSIIKKTGDGWVFS